MAVFVRYGRVDIVEGDVVEGGHAIAWFASVDQFCDDVGAPAVGQSGLTEAVFRVEYDGNGPAEWVEPPRIAGSSGSAS